MNVEKRKLLIATTNEGKFEEIALFLNDLNFDFLFLNNLKEKIEPPDEDQPTLEGNAIKKAKHYATETGLLALADDSGLFIDALDGWPGIKSAKIADSDDARDRSVIANMKNVPKEERSATFKNVLAVYDPVNSSYFVAYGEARGEILEQPVKERKAGFGYDPIFYIPEKKKSYAEMDSSEKNAVSHRGRALIKIKYFLHNHYAGQHAVVPIAYIIKDGKILMAKRNDPHCPEWHEKWETPGGIVEIGESVEETLVREVKEEAGYDVAIVSSLDTINTREHRRLNFHYQIYLIPFVCKIVGGNGKFNDNEILEVKWCEPENVLELDLIGTDGKMYEKLLPKLKEIIISNNL